MGGLDPPIQGNKYRTCAPGWRAYAGAMRRRPAMVKMREAAQRWS